MLFIFVIIIVFYFVYTGWGNPRNYNDGYVLPPLNNAIMGIIAVVMEADGATTKSELSYVKDYLFAKYGEYQAKQNLMILRNLLQKSEKIQDIRPHCVRINRNFNYPEKVQFLTLLFYIARANGSSSQAELRISYQYAKYTSIPSHVFYQLKERIVGQTEENYHEDNRRRYRQQQQQTVDNSESMLTKAYQILGVPSTATDAELKSRFRQLVKQWHPDKFAGHSEAEIENATKMFRKINNAYNYICKKRGIA